MLISTLEVTLKKSYPKHTKTLLDMPPNPRYL